MGNLCTHNSNPAAETADPDQLFLSENDDNQQIITIAAPNQSSMDYREEEARLQSYSSWPLRYMDPIRMATAGFYYTGQGDKVKCFECGISISEWEEGDNPLSDHQRWQSNCRFIRSLRCGNVPLGVNPSTVLIPSIRRHYGDEFRPNAVSGLEPNTPPARLIEIGDLKEVFHNIPKPEHPNFARTKDRLESFKHWPVSMAQTKEQLVEAGFYYEGFGDRTICYYCGGGLSDWEPEEDPWKQHAKWFKNCHFVLIIKGQDFIDDIIRKPATPHKQEEARQVIQRRSKERYSTKEGT
ncbi:death-associated inhibitor of apoptosis 1-like [Cotesia glomerata]|uniref:death-associated inhibitor of apoptosis 1-like n=1 Tax=Cotesia glomerata TaxID=32391 RepID=UPI001D011A8D|nr:death-associated inhibitor of apoptosis 1-like [Cotesia glomerata]